MCTVSSYNTHMTLIVLVTDPIIPFPPPGVETMMSIPEVNLQEGLLV